LPPLQPEVFNIGSASRSPRAIYIGRRHPRFPRVDLGKSVRIGKDGTREEVIAKFEAHPGQPALAGWNTPQSNGWRAGASRNLAMGTSRPVWRMHVNPEPNGKSGPEHADYGGMLQLPAAQRPSCSYGFTPIWLSWLRL
jgi:hypothetical protein